MGAALSDCPFPSVRLRLLIQYFFFFFFFCQWKLDGEQYHSLDSENSQLSHIPTVNPDYKPPSFLGEDVEEKHHTIFTDTPLSDVPTGNAVILDDDCKYFLLALFGSNILVFFAVH